MTQYKVQSTVKANFRLKKGRRPIPLFDKKIKSRNYEKISEERMKKIEQMGNALLKAFNPDQKEGG